jgi:hypothetical protein
MEKFASTKTLMDMLKSGEHKCLVMQNGEGDVLDTSSSERAKKTFEGIYDAYKDYTDHADNYDYFFNRPVLSDE